MAKASCRSGRPLTWDRIADNSSRRLRLSCWTSCIAERTLATDDATLSMDDASAFWFLCRSARDATVGSLVALHLGDG